MAKQRGLDRCQELSKMSPSGQMAGNIFGFREDHMVQTKKYPARRMQRRCGILIIRMLSNCD